MTRRSWSHILDLPWESGIRQAGRQENDKERDCFLLLFPFFFLDILQITYIPFVVIFFVLFFNTLFPFCAIYERSCRLLWHRFVVCHQTDLRFNISAILLEVCTFTFSLKLMILQLERNNSIIYSLDNLLVIIRFKWIILFQTRELIKNKKIHWIKFLQNSRQGKAHFILSSSNKQQKHNYNNRLSKNSNKSQSWRKKCATSD